MTKEKKMFDKKFWMFGWMGKERENAIKIENKWYARLAGGLYIEFIG